MDKVFKKNILTFPGQYVFSLFLLEYGDGRFKVCNNLNQKLATGENKLTLGKNVCIIVGEIRSKI